MVMLYCDSGSIEDIKKYADDDRIAGFTTNPSLMKKAGHKRYIHFADAVLNETDKPVSFEVLSDDWKEMSDQAHEIAAWGNTWVKIPVTNTKGESSIELIDELSDLNLNITAVMTYEQLEWLSTVVRPHHIISIFCGRIMDANGTVPRFNDRRNAKPNAQLLWASTRETKQIDAAEEWGYDIITMTQDLIAKLPLRGKDLKQYSLETVQQFFNDGRGIKL